MKKVVRLTESELTNIIKRTINENERVYGSENISKLYGGLTDDEYVHLDDSSGDLSGEIVTKLEYVKRMLNSAMQKEDWTKVQNTIRFIESMM
jgi:hypothetical protein